MLLSIVCVVVLLKTGECQLYRYGYSVGDNDTMATGSDPVHLSILPHRIQYLGKYYTEIYISKYGVLGFNKEIYFIEHHWRTNPEEANNPFIAPYYFKTALRTDNIPGSVFYRLETNEAFLDGLGGYLQSSIVGAAVQDFKPSFAIIVTWKNVIDIPSTTNDCLDEENNNICDKTNTFQLVLAVDKDKDQSFAIFNYEKMDVPKKPAYQAGMNGGLDGGWVDVYCDSDCSNFDFGQLPVTIASDVSGRFMYKVSDEVIVRGGCIPTTSANAQGKIEVYPKSVNSFGGDMIDVSGFCITSTTKVECKFGIEKPVEAKFISTMISRCLVPRLTARGLIKLEILIDGATSGMVTELKVALPGNTNQHLNVSLGWNETDAKRLEVTWDHAFLSEDPLATVYINLIGYRETENKVIWKKLNTFGSNVKNMDGRFQFMPSEYRCSGDDCKMFEIGQVEILLNKQFLSASNIKGFLSSYVQPLGWYFVDYMVKEYGKDWSTAKCIDWFKMDRIDMDWQEELLDCPCTLNQALTDFGRWQPDAGCNMFTGSVCTYHIGAIHCVRAFQPTESGAGNQCCYGPDGHVRYAADSYQGSTPDRGHDWGATPYNKPGYVPSLSHWKHDVITFYYCCLWVGYEDCDYYMDQRATRDCKDYKPPKTAIVFGDPHVITFDGFSYNAVGRGDFWLILTDSFKLQGRFDKIPAALTRTTAVIGLTLQETGSSKVEVRMSPPDRAHGRVLTVLVDDEVRLFDTKSSRRQDLKGLSIINTESTHGKHDNFTIIMKSGIGIMTAEKNGLLHVITVVPQSLMGKTTGLLGSWSEAESTQMRLPTGALVEKSSSTEKFYNDFIVHWSIVKNASMFRYPMKELQFQPLFDTPPLPESVTEDQITETCGNHRICQYDYRATANTNVASESKMAESWFQLINSYQKPVGSCGLLDVPRSTKSNYNYGLGSTITVTGCRKGLLSGETTYMCTENSDKSTSWKPDITAKCKVPLQTSSHANGLQKRNFIHSVLIFFFTIKLMLL